MSTIETGGPVGGMSPRDYFAAKAMQSLLTTICEFPDEHWRSGVAMDAYMMADAMLGYTRRGTGWVKKNAASTTQEAMNHGS